MCWKLDIFSSKSLVSKLPVVFLGFSLEEDFISWREQFWPAVCEHFGVEASGDESRCVHGQIVFGICSFHFSIIVLLSCTFLTLGIELVFFCGYDEPIFSLPFFCHAAFGSTSWRCTLTSTWTKFTQERLVVWRVLKSKSRKFRRVLRVHLSAVMYRFSPTVIYSLLQNALKVT